MKTIQYSIDKKYYYIEELACPFCDWIGTEKIFEEPELVKNIKQGISSGNWTDKLRGYYFYDNKYYRECLPFTFWKVKIGEIIQVEDNDELVLDYKICNRHIILPNTIKR